MASVTRSGGAGSDFPSADDAARDRGRLRESEARIAGQVVEFQLARQRAELVLPDVVEPLSTREREVLELLAAGRTDGEIADDLFISKKTASVHVANIKGKLGASSRVEIALFAERLGLTGDGVDGSSTSAWAVARAGRPADLCPFKGLAPFEPADAPFYFGRERLVADLVAHLVGATWLAVVGPSGSGKSSAVRAGLLPAMAGGVLPGSDTWRQVLIRPGTTPLATLRRALHDVARGQGVALPEDATIAELRDGLTEGTRLLVAVDQFEETFTLCRVEAERAAFLDALVAMANDPSARSLVVVAIRADFYGRCAAYPGLAALVGDGTVLVGPPSAEEIGRAIEAPARAAGLRVEPELTAELVHDVAGEPGALPLLSTTLLDLWTRRDGRILRAATYRRIGGVSGAVARLAEAAYAKLTADQQEVARGVLLRLAATGEGGVVVRRPVPLAELDADHDPDVRRVLDVLADARLITVHQATVEVAHEALLRDWPRVVDWFEADREGRRVRDHLRTSAGEWERSGEDPGELLRGARLAATLDWASGHQVELNALERRFLEACRSAAEQEVTRQRRTNRRLRGLLIGTVGLLVIALISGSFAFVQLDRAERETSRAASEALRAADEAQRAEAQATVARARELTAASVAVLDVDPSLAKLLAVSASRLMPPDVWLTSALRGSMAVDRTVHEHRIPNELDGLVTDLHPDGRLMVMSGVLSDEQQPVASLVDLATDEILWTFESPSKGAVVGQALFSTDGVHVITSLVWDSELPDPILPAPPMGVFILDSRTGRQVDRFDTGTCGTFVHAVSETVAITEVSAEPSEMSDCFSAGATFETIDLQTGRRAALVRDTLPDVALSRDGRFAAFTDVADGDRSVVVDLATGRRVLTLDRAELPQQDRYVRALSADGSILLYGDRPMTLYDVATGHEILRLSATGGESFHVAFAPSGSLIYTSGRDGTLRVWEGRTGDLIFESPAVGGGRPSAALDGRVLVADETEKVARLLDPSPRGEIGILDTCPGFVSAGQLQVEADTAAFSVLCSDGNAQTIVTDTHDLSVIATIPGVVGQDIALSPDGTRVAAQTGEDGGVLNAIFIFDARTGRPVTRLEGICDWDSGRFDIPRWEAGAGCKPFPNVPFGVWAGLLEFSPDGRWVLLRDDDGLAIWDAESGRLVKTLTGFDDWVSHAMFSPDSMELFASVGRDLLAISTETWEISRRGSVDPSLGPAGYVRFGGSLSDGTLVAVTNYGGSGGGSIIWIDPDTLAARDPVRAHRGSIKAIALDDDGTRIATSASDGVVRVWDSGTGDLLQDLRVSSQAQGVAFLDESRLAVTPATGDLLVFGSDGEAVLVAARASLIRGFTPDECERFGFGADCPTLEELRGPSSDGD